MRKHKLFSLFLILSLSFFSLQTAFAESDPVNLLQHVADGMISGLEANKATLKSKPQVVYDLAYKYVVPNADLVTMSKRVLPPQIWNQASEHERLDFQKEFTKTLIRTYASALTSYRNQEVKFYPARGGSHHTAEVRSVIQSPSNPPINVTYRLVNSNGGWKLYDLSVEGVSMLESFRAQFSDILEQGNMSELLKRMKGHNQRG